MTARGSTPAPCAPARTSVIGLDSSPVSSSTSARVKSCSSSSGHDSCLPSRSAASGGDGRAIARNRSAGAWRPANRTTPERSGERLPERSRRHCASPSLAWSGSGGTTVRCGLAGRCSISQTFSRTSRVASSASASPSCTASARAWMVRYARRLAPPARAPAGAREQVPRRAGTGCSDRDPVSSAIPRSLQRGQVLVSDRLALADSHARQPTPWCPPGRPAAASAPPSPPAARQGRPGAGQGPAVPGGGLVALPGRRQPCPHLAHAWRSRPGSMLPGTRSPGA